MANLHYTTKKPTEPGWYWCRNEGDLPGQLWEAIVRVDYHGTISSDRVLPNGLCVSWMTAPGEIGLMHERDWSEQAEWAGPITPPASERRRR